MINEFYELSIQKIFPILYIYTSIYNSYYMDLYFSIIIVIKIYYLVTLHLLSFYSFISSWITFIIFDLEGNNEKHLLFIQLNSKIKFLNLKIFFSFYFFNTFNNYFSFSLLLLIGFLKL